MTHIQARLTIAIAAAAALFLLPSTAAAQLNGTNLKGDVGLKAGSQAPPGVYIAVPIWLYTADAVKDRNGDQILTGNIDTAIYGPALSVVTKKKVFGANYGFFAILPWANNRVQGAEDFDANPGAGLTDMYVQPINLGWTRRAPTSPPPMAWACRSGATKMAPRTIPASACGHRKSCWGRRCI